MITPVEKTAQTGLWSLNCSSIMLMYSNCVIRSPFHSTRSHQAGARYFSLKSIRCRKCSLKFSHSFSHFSIFRTCCPSCRCRDHIYMSDENRSILQCNLQRLAASASPALIGRISRGLHNYSYRTAPVAGYRPADNSGRRSKKCDCGIKTIRRPF